MVDQLPPDPDPSDAAQVDPPPDALAVQDQPGPDPSIFLPPLGQVLGPPPQVPVPSLPVMPAQTAQDPKQHLLAIAALGAMLGLGKQGGAGVGAGLLSAQAHMDAQKQSQFNYQVQVQQHQQAQAAAAQRQSDAIYEKRAQDFQKVLLGFRAQLDKTTSQDDYDRLIANYSGALQASGYPRATEQWFRQEFKFIPPTAEKTIETAIDKVVKSEPYKKATAANPDAWQTFAISVPLDPAHPKVLTQLPLQQAYRRLGVQQTVDPLGNVGFTPLTKGTKEQNDITEATGAFVEQHGHAPQTPADNTWIMDRVAHRNAEAQAMKRDPLAEELARLRIADAKAKGTPTAIQPGSREEKIAYDLAYGKLTFSQFRSLYSYSRDVNAKTAIYEKAGELNPKFNPASFEMGYTLAKSPKVQQQLASMSNVLRAVPDLLRVSDEAARSKSPTLNGYISRGRGFVIGDKRYSNLALARIAYADELSGALGFGSATDMNREMGLDLTDTSLSPDAFADGIKTIVVPFIERKRDTLLEQEGIYGQPGMNPAAPTTPTANPNRFTIVPRGGQ